MTAPISAELLRLRTIRSPRYVALGVLAVIALPAALPLVDSSGDAAPRADDLADALRSLALMGVLVAAAFTASSVGAKLKRGATAVTYLGAPRRPCVAAARALAYSLAA